jgi:hypothetical protein
MISRMVPILMIFPLWAGTASSGIGADAEGAAISGSGHENTLKVEVHLYAGAHMVSCFPYP